MNLIKSLVWTRISDLCEFFKFIFIKPLGQLVGPARSLISSPELANWLVWSADDHLIVDRFQVKGKNKNNKIK